MLLALGAACSGDPDNICDQPAPGVEASFDPSSMVLPGDRLTEIQLCATNRCRKEDFTSAMQLGQMNQRLPIPFDFTTFVITNLTVTVYDHGRVIRTARAPGPIMVLTPEEKVRQCVSGGVEVRYNETTKDLESRRLFEPGTVNPLPGSNLNDVPAGEPSGSPAAVPPVRRQLGGPPPMIDGRVSSTPAK